MMEERRSEKLNQANGPFGQKGRRYLFSENSREVSAYLINRGGVHDI
jgi:hypothetical protein